MRAPGDQPDRAPAAASDTTLRLDGLSKAVEAARGRVDDALLDEAAEVVRRGRRRLGLSSEHTIVALAGATGSGKSSLFNALCDLDLAAVGFKRPTTSWALACTWGSEGATEILAWLDIPERQQVNRTGLLDETAVDRDLHGLVLLDLPDHDSTEVSHHLEVGRLVELADVLVWVLDPQKYADAAIHDRYLRPLNSHAEVMLVVLNHIDEIPAGGVESCLFDVRRLLELDGLGAVPVLATSVTEGDGIQELRATLVTKVAAKTFALERVDADVAAMARRIQEGTGSAQPADLGADVHKRLLDACADSAGVPVLVLALESTALIRARRATAWSLTAPLARFRSDPMSRLPHVDGPADEIGDTPTTRPASAPAVQRVGVDAAVRKVVDEITSDMGEPWKRSVRDAATGRLDAFVRSLEAAVSRADLSGEQAHGGWSAVRLLQWALLTTAVVGGIWSLAIVATDAFAGERILEPEIGGISLPLILLCNGLALGFLTAMLGRLAARSWARRKAANDGRRLRAVVATKTDEFVVSPLKAEIDAYSRCRDGLRAALGR